MRLGTRTVLILTISSATLCVALYTVSTKVVEKGFAELEERHAQLNVDRILRAIEDRGRSLGTSVADWATWDDTYHFVLDRNDNYIKANLTPEAFKNLKIHQMLFVNLEGALSWGSAFDLEEGKERPVPEELLSLTTPTSPLMRSGSGVDGTSGLLLLKDGPLLVAARPILTNKKEGPPHGVLIMGRFLDAAAEKDLKDTLQMQLAIHRADALPDDPAFKETMGALSNGVTSTIRLLDDNSISGYGLIRDLRGNPAVLIEVKMQRDIHAQGLRTSSIFTGLLVLVCALFSVAIVIMLRWQIIARLERLRQDIARISTSADLSQRVHLDGSDELSDVAKGLNRMLTAVQDSRRDLSKSEEAFRSVVESSPSAMYFYRLEDNDRLILSRFNPAADKIIGISHQGLVGKTIEEAFPNLRFTGIPDLYRKVARGEIEPQSFEVPYTDERFSGFYEVHVFRSGPNAIVVNFTEISKRKQMEDRLRQSEKMGAIGQLAGGIAHDFNNQIAPVMGYAEMLRDQLEDKPLRQYAEHILTASRRAADLTRNLLAFARKGKYQAIPVDIHSVVGEVVALLERSIDKRIGLRQDLRANPHVIIGDPSQLQNALLNLALNARDAMPHGGDLTLTTDVVDIDERYCQELARELSPGRYLQVCVTDTGVGMDEDVKKHLFEPFFTTKAQGKGTGMGLAAVYGTVTSHHGMIDVHTEVGRGTTFRLRLPLPESPMEADLHETTGAFFKSNARILIVEDEELVRGLVADMLRELGHKVTTSASGEEAVSYYAQAWEHIDLVILDMVMPGMDGHSTFVAMRRINPGIKALLASGFSLDGEAQSILDEGVLGFLQKPFRKAELSTTIATALGQVPLIGTHGHTGH